jgi:hypothetical protein
MLGASSYVDGLNRGARMHSYRLFLRLAGFAMLTMVLISCATSSSSVETGMTPDEAVRAMGQPDLKDSVADPRGSGASVLRYAWVSQGKVATFGPDNRVAKVGDLPTGAVANSAPANSVAVAEASTPPPIATSFDPIQTPLNYIFYPLKFGLTWLGAGINCVAEGNCRQPEVKPPDAG